MGLFCLCAFGAVRQTDSPSSQLTEPRIAGETHATIARETLGLSMTLGASLALLTAHIGSTSAVMEKAEKTENSSAYPNAKAAEDAANRLKFRIDMVPSLEINLAHIRSLMDALGPLSTTPYHRSVEETLTEIAEELEQHRKEAERVEARAREIVTNTRQLGAALGRTSRQIAKAKALAKAQDDGKRGAKAEMLDRIVDSQLPLTRPSAREIWRKIQLDPVPGLITPPTRPINS